LAQEVEICRLDFSEEKARRERNRLRLSPEQRLKLSALDEARELLPLLTDASQAGLTPVVLPSNSIPSSRVSPFAFPVVQLPVALAECRVLP
jgi:hypothetical protein